MVQSKPASNRLLGKLTAWQRGSVAVAHGLTLVTHNTRHFAGRIGIGLEDWVPEYEAGQPAK